jgi:riboflavin synthase
VIPHTLAVTTLGTARAGRRVNLETDMIGKYVIRALGPGMAGAVGGTQS